MRTVAIVPADTAARPAGYRAIAGQVQAMGKTAGEALDALAAQLGEAEGGTLIVVQHRRPDAFFTAREQQRLQELMGRWREARDAGGALPVEEQAELGALVHAELRAAAARAAALADGLAP